MVDHKHIVVSKKLVAINSASTVAARIINFFVLLWVYQYLLKRLPAEEFAILPLVTALMVFGPLFFSFFVGGVSRYTIDAYAKGDFVEVRRIVSSLFPILLAAAGVFWLGGMAVAANIEKVFNVAPQIVPDARLMMALLVSSFVMEMLISPFKTAYAVRQRYVEQSLLQASRDILRAVMIVAGVVFIDPAVIWVVVATFVSDILLNTIFLIRSLRMVPELRVERRLFSFAQARTLMNFGMWTTLGRMGAIMFTNAATIVLNLFGTPVGVTSYHIGATFFRQIQSTINLATIPLQPAITAMNALDDRKRLASTVMRGGRYALWASMLIATPLAIYADSFVALYLGPDYADAATIIILFMAMFPLLHPTMLLAQTAIAMARVREFFLPAFLFPLGGLIAMLIWVMGFDGGAVEATLVLFLMTAVTQLSYFWGLLLHFTGVRFAAFRSKVLLPGFLPALSGAVVWAGLHFLHRPGDWLTLIAFGASGAIVYVLVLVGFCLNRSERSDLHGLLVRTGAS